jgi:hypothetical protein
MRVVHLDFVLIDGLLCMLLRTISLVIVGFT